MTFEEVRKHNIENPDNEICEFCLKSPADWFYGPSNDPEQPSVACDDCVPRGCSCNQELIDYDRYDDLEYCKDPNNWTEELDEKGRRYPCVEWFDY